MSKKNIISEKNKNIALIVINIILSFFVIFYCILCNIAILDDSFNFTFFSRAVKGFYKPIIQVPSGVACFLIILFSLSVVFYFIRNIIHLFALVFKKDKKYPKDYEKYAIHLLVTTGCIAFFYIFGDGFLAYVGFGFLVIYFVLKSIQIFAKIDNFYVRIGISFFLVLAIISLLIILTHLTPVGLLFFLYAGIIFCGWGFMFYPYKILTHKKIFKSSILNENLISTLLFFLGITSVFIFLLSNL